MRKIETLTVHSDATIEDVIRIIDRGGLQIALMVDNTNKLLGTITDGDVRRAILSGASLDQGMMPYINKQFYSVDISHTEAYVLNLMKQKNIHQMPVLDGNYLVGIQVLDDLIMSPDLDVAVVIMAGGLGTRLSPYTDNCPKPMLKVGDKPILQIIVESLAKQGLRKIYLSVNYLKDMIIDHFADGSHYGVEIEYLSEDEPMGTAGALSLLKVPEKQLLVLNGDVLTRVDYSRLVEKHINSNAKCTVCVRKYPVDIPFGVVEMEENGQVNEMVEKPTYDYFVNAGIYMLDGDVVPLLNKGERLDMPDLIKKAMQQNMVVTGFPVYEYWLDIGRHSEFEKAHHGYNDHFLND